MGRSWTMTIPMPPPTVTHNDLVVRRTRDGRAFVGKSDRLRAVEDSMRSRVMRQVPEVPLSGPLSARLTYCYPSAGRHPQGSPMTSKPDADNLAKTTLDVVAACGVMRDDCEVCDLRVVKAWRDPACIVVSIRELEAR